MYAWCIGIKCRDRRLNNIDHTELNISKTMSQYGIKFLRVGVGDYATVDFSYSLERDYSSHRKTTTEFHEVQTVTTQILFLTHV